MNNKKEPSGHSRVKKNPMSEIKNLLDGLKSKLRNG